MTEIDSSQRRLPVYLLLDTSGSMTGEPIQAVRTGVKNLLAELKSDPQALETVWLSVITFDSTADQVVPLTELMNFKEPSIDAGGSTSMGAALQLLESKITSEVRKSSPDQKGDWKPLIFLMTDGEPTDSWENPADSLKSKRPGNIIACGAGTHVNESTLKRITENVVLLKDVQPETLSQFFKWVSQSISTQSKTVTASGDTTLNLPPPPDEIELVP